MPALPALLALLSLAPPLEGELRESRPGMGTLLTVAVVAPPERARAGIDAAFAVFDRVDRVMNEWRPDSPLSRLNARAGRGWVTLPADLCEVLRIARRGARETGGLFDPTWAAVSELWRFDGTEQAPPPDDAVRARCALVGWRGLELRARRGGPGCEARLQRAGMKVGLGGLAKGWAVDRAARRLRALGLRDFLLQAGGDLYAAGRRGGAPWHVAIRDPRGGPLDAMAALDVSDRAFSTSGDYEHAFEAGGRRYHHLIDPRTCRPSPASRAVTVLARTAVEAEILGKAAFLEGGEAGLARVEAAGAAAILVGGDGAVRVSPALAGRLVRAARDAPAEP
ncbi:FAD:protein FMN transferase [Anaeromyxobacter sp. PSR-1]|uniref:FAD:protein FMN transferase n=1 Tax=Anaeromyxobacter sp. PSR-1 TaxID=1300915 RepID=UPI0005E9B95B|nr:FAD:protein FMN transferase [Anaeromyxobacter sp. PSR-1]GAO03458.1 thiamine biosynthesis lipoprotein ApbE [Anaeromyxobacter sp. PSR-1]